MRQVIAGKPLLDLIELCYAADRPLLLIGKHGIGKSEVTDQAAKHLKVGYKWRDLSLMEPPDLIGMPDLDREEQVTRFFPPAFLPTEGKGILAFEELNRCPQYMRAPCLQLLTARMLNDYTLPKGWLPMASINPPDAMGGGGYDVQELDPALLSRFVKVHVVPGREEWLEWAAENDLHEKVVEYVGRESKIFTDTSPRDWKYTSDLLKAKEGAKEARKGAASALRAALAGVLGRERSAAFERFLKGQGAIPPILEVLGRWETYKKQVTDWAAARRVDVFEDYVYALKVHLQNEDNYRAIRNEGTKEGKNLWKALKEFLKMIPPDQREDVVQDMASRGYECPV